MGSRGGDSPDGLPQRHLSTLFLRAPHQDWAALTQGYKTEFRLPPRGKMADRFQAPTPVVLYAVSPQRKHRTEKLMILTHHHSEQLMDIGGQPDALLREGMATYDHFRSYWRARTRKPYVPLASVEVFRLAPWPWDTQSLQIDHLGRVMLNRLYGDYL